MNKLVTVIGELCGTSVQMTGSSVSLITQEIAIKIFSIGARKAVQVRLVTASGEPMPIVGSVKATLRIGKLRQPVT